MRRRCTEGTAVVWIAAVAGAASAASLPIASKGRALVPIVVSAKASERTRSVAAELAAYLGRISGAEFKIVRGDGASGIVLGTLEEFPHPALVEPLAIRNTYDGREAYAIRTEPARLLLIGASELGASHAAFRFLELLGCRWFFPATEWEVVPRLPELSGSWNETDRPRILARRIWYGYGLFHDKGHPRGGSVQKDYEAWARHNRMASSFRVNAGHAWQSIIAANQKLFDQHPEYRAMVKGKREGEQLCVSNPEVRKLAIAYALEQLRKNPDAEMVSMECSDGDGQCECPNCQRLGSVSDRVFGLANEVAGAVGREFPGKMVGVLAYNQHAEPPSFPLAPNVYVQLTAGFIRGKYTHDELLALWPKRCANLGFYEYFSVWLWDFDRLPGGNGANIARTQSMLRRYVAAGATSLDAESGNNWGPHGRGYYIANRLMWNPDANVEELLADFYEKAFGPGADAMQRFYERWSPDREPLLSRGLVGAAFRDVYEAARRAADRPDVLARLDQIKHYLRYVHLRWRLDHSTDKAERKSLTVAALTHVYRTRYEYMNHWAAMRSTWVEQAVKAFDEPNWALSDPAPKPWLVDRSVTREETEAWFREGLDYFKPTTVAEKTFSSELVPTGFEDPKPPPPMQQQYQRPAYYALHSRNGEPIHLELTPGVIAWYRDRPDARYELRDGAGAVVGRGTLPLDGAAHPLVLPVPRAGTYYFECEDSAAGWKIAIEPGRPAVLLNRRNRGYLHLGYVQQLYFFVPKGTRALQYFWSGGPHKVLDPAGKVKREVTASDEDVTIPVPTGADGACWSFSPHAHGHLWFYNVPNCLAASPGTLLVPRELLAGSTKAAVDNGKQQEPARYRWVRVTGRAAFAPRDGAGAAVFKGRMWLLGGWNPGDKRHFPRICNNEVWSSADGADWTLKKPNTFIDRSFNAAADWEGRHTAGYVVFKDKLWIVGGDVNQGHYQNDVWCSADGKTWSLVNPDAPVPWGPRALHYTVAFRDRIWVIGGQTMPAFAPGKEAFYRDIWTSDDGRHWEKLAPSEPYWPARGMIGGTAVFKDRVWIIGGGTYDTPSTPQRRFYNDVWSSADGVAWTCHVEHAPWTPRQYHEVAVFDDRLWVLEGYSGQNRNDVWYSTDGVAWHELPDTPWKPRHAASVFVHNDALWVVAGNNMESDVWKLERRR